MSGFELGAVLTGFFPDSVRDGDALRRAIALAAGTGFRGVEFFYDGPDSRSVAEDLRGAGLSSVYLPAYAMKKEGLDLGADSRAERDRAVSRGKEWIERAAAFGSRSVMVISGPEREAGADRDRAACALAESLRTLCSFASSASPPVRVSLEAFNNQGEPYLLMGPTSRCLALVDAVGQTRGEFGITFDLSHCLQLGETPALSAAALAGRCRHIHLANCVIRDRADPLFGDKHPPFGIAGGEVDEPHLAAFLRRLRELGYFSREDRPTLLGLEVIARPPAEGERAMADALAAFNRALAAVEQI